jgi:CheY-like chemotaxis protein
MSERQEFEDTVRDALYHLYDPAALRETPLLAWLGLQDTHHPAHALQTLLLKTIEGLRPAAPTPRESAAGRFYRILNHRYVEQFTQRDVAMDLALSVRQLRRCEKQAIQVLADVLWDISVVQAASPARTAMAEPPQQEEMAPTPDEELQRLRTLGPEPLSLGALIAGVLTTLDPYLQSTGVEVALDFPSLLPEVNARRIALRQALMNLISVAARHSLNGRLAISANQEPDGWVTIEIRGNQGSGQPSMAQIDEDTRHSTQSLVEVAGGVLECLETDCADARVRAVLRMPACHQVKVLGIDDNRDILQMMERYLSGTPYQFSGCDDPLQALSLAEALAPDIIVLDVMLPQLDGWELVGRLREHPRTRAIPIVICTILPQEELAALLGAAAFVRKPLKREALLLALARHCGPGAKTDAPRW